MNNFFENHLEEIKSITNRSKKDSRLNYSRLQQASELRFKLKNKKIIRNEIIILEGINLHQTTSKGEILQGSSDRIYLPDLATRVYQGLDGIAKSYESHKVHTSLSLPTHNSENTSSINHIDLSEWDIEYLTEISKNLFESIPDELKKSIDINFDFHGLYSIWNIVSPKQKIVEFDEFNLILNILVVEKSSLSKIFDYNYRITNSSLRNKRVDLESISNKLNTALEIYNSVKIKNTKINYDNIIISNNLISKLFYNCENYKDASLDTNKILIEEYDKFGLASEDLSQIDQNYLKPRQYKYYSEIKFSPCNIKFNDKTSDITDIDTKKLIEIIKKQFKNTKTIIVLTGEISENTKTSRKIIYPDFSLYYDGNELYRVKIDSIKLPEDFENISYSDLFTQTLINEDSESYFYIGSIMPLYAYFNKEKIK